MTIVPTLQGYCNCFMKQHRPGTQQKPHREQCSVKGGYCHYFTCTVSSLDPLTDISPNSCSSSLQKKIKWHPPPILMVPLFPNCQEYTTAPIFGVFLRPLYSICNQGLLESSPILHYLHLGLDPLFLSVTASQILILL